MIDFHSHILPGIDDGSSSVEESIAMLQTSYRQGVRKIVATPHFYANKESPDSFLKRREASWRKLQEALKASARPDDSGKTEIPEIYLGAEVYYYTGISHTATLSRLCTENTSILLLEMPFHKWSERMLEEVLSLARDTDLTILLAHIDRYLPCQTTDTWEELYENDVLFQVNASAFLGSWRDRHKAYKLLKNDQIAVLGSDCHNMRTRQPNLASAYSSIGDKLGEEKVKEMIKKADALLTNCTCPEYMHSQ